MRVIGRSELRAMRALKATAIDDRATWIREELQPVAVEMTPPDESPTREAFHRTPHIRSQ